MDAVCHGRFVGAQGDWLGIKPLAWKHKATCRADDAHRECTRYWANPANRGQSLVLSKPFANHFRPFGSPQTGLPLRAPAYSIPCSWGLCSSPSTHQLHSQTGWSSDETGPVRLNMWAAALNPLARLGVCPRESIDFCST